MNESKFVLSSDIVPACIKLQIYIDGQLVSDSDIDSSQIKFVDQATLDQYSSILSEQILTKFNEFKKSINNIDLCNSIIKQIHMIQDKRITLDIALKERDANV
jgi:hypothetical protein